MTAGALHCIMVARGCEIFFMSIQHFSRRFGMRPQKALTKYDATDRAHSPVSDHSRIRKLLQRRSAARRARRVGRPHFIAIVTLGVLKTPPHHKGQWQDARGRVRRDHDVEVNDAGDETWR